VVGVSSGMAAEISAEIACATVRAKTPLPLKCHVDAKHLQRSAPKVSAIDHAGEAAMKAMIDRFLQEIQEEWLVLWLLDDL
jgi:hypothetical protein